MVLNARPRGRRHLGATSAWIAGFVACLSCAPSEETPPAVPHLILVSARNEPLDMLTATQRARLTVLVFFSPHCHCLDVHEPRLLALNDMYQTSGVQFLMIDSEVGASPERDGAEARARHYPFPILIDRGAELARAVGARYATYAVVLDASGRIHYRGSIDSDKTHLHEDAILYLRDAIADLLTGRTPRAAFGEGLGCALQTW